MPLRYQRQQDYAHDQEIVSILEGAHQCKENRFARLMANQVT